MKQIKRYSHLPFYHDEYRRSYGIDDPRPKGRLLFFVLLAVLIGIACFAWFVLIPHFPDYVRQFWGLK